MHNAYITKLAQLVCVCVFVRLYDISVLCSRGHWKWVGIWSVGPKGEESLFLLLPQIDKCTSVCKGFLFWILETKRCSLWTFNSCWWFPLAWVHICYLSRSQTNNYDLITYLPGWTFAIMVYRKLCYQTDNWNDGAPNFVPLLVCPFLPSRKYWTFVKRLILSLCRFLPFSLSRNKFSQCLQLSPMLLLFCW